MSEPRIILNRIVTPDGTILTSYTRHDYKGYTDANGEYYMTDGGNSYIRRSVNKEPYEDLTLYEDSPFEDIRKNCHWGTYGKEGDFSQAAKQVPIMSLSDAHIENIIADGYQGITVDMMKRELKYRKSCGIVLED